MNVTVPKVHPCTFGKLEPDQPGTKHNKEYEVTPSASPKLPTLRSGNFSYSWNVMFNARLSILKFSAIRGLEIEG
jgi:hypothetical protein